MDKQPSTIEKKQKLIGMRFGLRRCLSETPFGQIHWASDLYSRGAADMAMVFLPATSLTHLDHFADVWQSVLAQQAPASPSWPKLIAHGLDKGQFWYATAAAPGDLMSEQLKDQAGNLTLGEATHQIQYLADQLNNLRADGFPYWDPGCLFSSDEGIIALHAPLVTILLRLLERFPDSRNKLSLDSPFYSPEVVSGAQPTPEDNTYAAGVWFHWLLSGKEPTNRSFPALEDLNQSQQNAIDTALQSKRAYRQDSAFALINQLEPEPEVQNKRYLYVVGIAVLALGLTAIFWPQPPTGGTVTSNPDNTELETPRLTIVQESTESPSVETLAESTENETSSVFTNAAETQNNNDSNGDDEQVDLSNNLPEAEPETVPTTTEAPLEEPEITEAEQQVLSEFEAQGQTQLAEKDRDGLLLTMRDIQAIDARNPHLTTLGVAQTKTDFNLARRAINAGKLDTAKAKITAAEELMREFVITDPISDLVNTENRYLATVEKRASINRLLKEAQNAYKKGG